ncbi:hypothetical protein NN561_016700 [Cricetulus griseus]
MLPPYAKPARRRRSALQRQEDDANRPGAASVAPSAPRQGKSRVLETFSPSSRESTSSIIHREYNSRPQGAGVGRWAGDLGRRSVAAWFSRYPPSPLRTGALLVKRVQARALAR